MHKASPILYMMVLGWLLFAGTGCEKAFNLRPPAVSNQAVFNELWQVMDERYALFGAKAVNWQDVYRQYSSRIDDRTPGQTAFRIMADMLETLKDGHVGLMSPVDTAGYDMFHTAFPTNFNYANILANYLKSDHKTSGPLVYKVVNNVGYIYYSSFYLDITDNQLDKVFAEMNGTRGLIIDVRHNTGGRSVNVDKLARRFMTQRTLVKYEVQKKGPKHDDLSDPEPYYLVAGQQPYTAPVIVLTNRTCFSACNDFVLYMSQLPNVQRMGDQTGGGGAIPHQYVLANGWKLQYSATITLSAGKQIVEQGITPHISIDITPIDESNGKDPIIDKAFQTLQ